MAQQAQYIAYTYANNRLFCAKRSMQPMVGNCNKRSSPYKPTHHGLCRTRRAYISRHLPHPHYIRMASTDYFYTRPHIRTNRVKARDRNWSGMALKWEEKANNNNNFYTRPHIRTNREKAGDRNLLCAASKLARKKT